MLSIPWIFCLLSIVIIGGYENLSRRKTTRVSQSSTYHEASLAIDGNKDLREPFCAHTFFNKSLAWFQVDLGKLYRLRRIRIWFRDEGKSYGWRPFRLRQFYLDVSNYSVEINATTERVRCYKDNTTNSEIPPNNVNTSCTQTARYVRIESTYHAPEDWRTTGPVLEICEIEIYGCSINCMDGECNTNGYCSGCTDSNFWGPTCDIPCSEHCLYESCIRDTGLCDLGCSWGFWGRQCNLTCNVNCNHGGCFQNNGYCINGCKPYFSGENCDFCDSYHFGADCTSECNKNCRNGTCFLNGSCVLGCTGKAYGDKCEKGCRNCAFGCDRLSGICVNGCVKGRYGEFCNNVCRKGCVSDCDQHSGHCKCLDGWQGDSCYICDSSHYGDSCEITCSRYCLNNTCFANNGTCTLGCSGNFKDSLCTSENTTVDSTTSITTYIGAGVGIFLFLLLSVSFFVFAIRLKRRQQSTSTTSVIYNELEKNQKDKTNMYSTIGSIPIKLEDIEEKFQKESLGEPVYYSTLPDSMDISIANLQSVKDK